VVGERLVRQLPIALHGLESHLQAAFATRQLGRKILKPLVVRYADDFVVLHDDLAVVEQCQQFANRWLLGPIAERV
jgi:RNA-directed DNA polymerase